MKSTLCIFFIALFFTVSAQDRILKTDGTIITGKVVSFQNNRLVVLQEDETEMTFPRKAIAEIKFDFQETVKITAKSVETPTPIAEKTLPIAFPEQETPPAPKVVTAPAPVSTPVPYSTVPKDIKKESPPTPAVVKTAPVLVQKSLGTINMAESPGKITGLEARTLISFAPLKEKPLSAGRVAVDVCLNTEGRVVTAKFKAVGSSTFDADLISTAVQNAREFKFEKGNNGDCGVVTYRFNLD